MDNPRILSEGFTCEELAEALLVKLKPFIQESIREELAKINEGALPEKSNEKVAGFISDEPKISDVVRFTIGEASKLLNIHTGTLRKYNEEWLIRSFSRFLEPNYPNHKIRDDFV